MTTPHYHGHRQRLREKIQRDAKALDDYEVLELLLGYVIRRADTKPLAKELLDRFGTLHGVFNAGRGELAQVKGFGPSLDLFWTLWRETWARLHEAPLRKRDVITHPSDIADMAMARLGPCRAEEFWVALVDNKNRLLAWECASTGTVDEAPVYPREVLAKALQYQASGIIVVHNHPGGDPKPSAKDIDLTRRLVRAGGDLGVRVLDHLIVTDTNYYSFQSEGMLQPWLHRKGERLRRRASIPPHVREDSRYDPCSVHIDSLLSHTGLCAFALLWSWIFCAQKGLTTRLSRLTTELSINTNINPRIRGSPVNTRIFLQKKTDTHDSPGVTIMPPLFFNFCLGIGIVLELTVSWQLPLPFLPFLLGGLTLALIGFWFMMWGHTRFQKLGVNVKTNMPAQSLVLQGAYQHSRNPMYVGFLAILTGIGLAARSGWLLLAVLPLAAYLRFYVISREEAYLRRRFGEEYTRYCKKVRRWL